MKPIDKLYLNVGQMKAGTTLLSRFLRKEDAFFFTPEKEIHFWGHHYGPFQLLGDYQRLSAFKAFSARLGAQHPNVMSVAKTIDWYANYIKKPDSLGWYMNLFSNAPNSAWWCDFSNLTCLLESEQFKEVDSMVNNLKVSYMVRNPVKRAWSHLKFHHKVAGAKRPLTDYTKDEMLVFLRSDNIWPQTKVADHLDNILVGLGEDKVKILVFEELVSNPEKSRKELAEFLDTPIFGAWSTDTKVNAGPSLEMPEYFVDMFYVEFKSQLIKLRGVSDGLLKAWGV